MAGHGSFTHLHTHTEFSMLDGAARVDDLVDAAVADGQPALGITDHGNMYGVLDFYAACRDAGHQPGHRHRGLHGRRVPPRAPGAPGQGRRHRRRRRGGREALLPPDAAGRDHRGLPATSSSCRRPPTSRATTTSPGSTGSSSSATTTGSSPPPGAWAASCSRRCWPTTRSGPLKLAGRLQDIFGRDNLFVELQDHGLPEQRKTNPALVDIARQLGAPLLATNDSHYTHREDAVAHDALLCVQTGALIDDPKRFKFEGEEHYLKSAAEMRHLFAELPEACDNTLLIAERADVEIEFGVNALPEFPVPAEFTGDTYEERADAYLRHLTFDGAEERYGRTLPAEVSERLDYELGVIANMGFSAYFLVVWDLIRHARTSGIRVGPGAGIGRRLLRGLLPADRRPRPHPLRPALRAVPQPRAQADARHRHGLRRALPGRDDPVRQPSATAPTTWPRS